MNNNHTPLPKVLFIGLGMMGRPMATLIAKAGYPLLVSDTNTHVVEEVCTALGAARFEGAHSLTDVSVVITMLPNSKVVNAVLLGENGIAKGLKKDTCIIDMSSSEPLETQRLAQELSTLSINLLDAPVSGGVKRATAGTLQIMVGGAVEVMTQHAGLLEVMRNLLSCPTIIAEVVKKFEQVESNERKNKATGLLATVEALHVGEKFGIDPAVMTNVLNNASGGNFTTANKVHQFMLSGTYASGFALQLMVKDLKIAVNLAEQMTEDMKLGHQCLSVWQEAAQSSTPQTDHTEMYRIVGNHG